MFSMLKAGLKHISKIIQMFTTSLKSDLYFFRKSLYLSRIIADFDENLNEN